VHALGCAIDSFACEGILGIALLDYDTPDQQL